MPHRPTERLPELRAVLQLCCGMAELLTHSESDWGSATFTGRRHIIGLRFKGGDAIAHAEALICELPSHEFTLAGKIVCDASIVAVDRVCKPEPETTMAIELLILDDT